MIVVAGWVLAVTEDFGYEGKERNRVSAASVRRHMDTKSIRNKEPCEEFDFVLVCLSICIVADSTL